MMGSPAKRIMSSILYKCCPRRMYKTILATPPPLHLLEWLFFIKLRNFFHPSLHGYLKFPNTIMEGEDFVSWAALRRTALRDANEQVGHFSVAFAKTLATSVDVAALEKKRQEEEEEKKKKEPEKKKDEEMSG